MLFGLRLLTDIASFVITQNPVCLLIYSGL